MLAKDQIVRIFQLDIKRIAGRIRIAGAAIGIAVIVILLRLIRLDLGNRPLPRLTVIHTGMDNDRRSHIVEILEILKVLFIDAALDPVVAR